MSGGFGTGFGSVPFGSASFAFGSALLSLTLVQLSANLLGVQVGGDPDEKLDASNWTLTPLDPDAHPRLVQSAQAVTSTNEDGFELPQLVLVTLPATLLAMDGVLTYGKRYRLTFGASSFDFTAMLVAASAAPADVRTDDGFIWDIANPYLTRDALVFPPQLGTYQVTDAGDYGIDKSGEAGLRKRITRRVLAAAGAYFHLGNYGAGLQLRRNITVDALRRMSARIRSQVLQEPEVQTTVCRLTQDPTAPGVVYCTIDASTGASSVQVVVQIRLP